MTFKAVQLKKACQGIGSLLEVIVRHPLSTVLKGRDERRSGGKLHGGRVQNGSEGLAAEDGHGFLLLVGECVSLKEAAFFLRVLCQLFFFVNGWLMSVRSLDRSRCYCRANCCFMERGCFFAFEKRNSLLCQRYPWQQSKAVSYPGILRQTRRVRRIVSFRHADRLPLCRSRFPCIIKSIKCSRGAIAGRSKFFYTRFICLPQSRHKKMWTFPPHICGRIVPSSWATRQATPRNLLLRMVWTRRRRFMYRSSRLD